MPGLVEVTFKEGLPNEARLGQFMKSNAFVLERFIPTVNGFYFSIPAGTEVTAVRRLRGNAAIRSVSVVPKVFAAMYPDLPAGPGEGQPQAPLAFAPNDTNFGGQWNLNQMSAPAAWDTYRGGLSIGVIDSGINSHADLNVVDSVNFSPEPTTADNCGHGTAMSGIAAAQTNNTIGNAGVNGGSGFSANVVNIKLLATDCSSGVNRLADAIRWGADRYWVLNASLITTCTQVILDAVLYSWNVGTILVASTGNSNSTNFTNLCPAASPYAIAVGGTNGKTPGTGEWSYGTDKRWSVPLGDPGPAGYGSNWGSPGINVSAPSTWIWVTTSAGGYSKWSWAGTSGAAAHVSGLVSLMMARWGVQTPAWHRSKLENSSDKVGGYNYGWSGYCGGQSAELGCGRVNAWSALQ